MCKEIYFTDGRCSLLNRDRDEIISLFDAYGGLLTQSCRDCIELYYCDDLSLSEIAESMGISRQGARDAIKRGEAELQHIESVLGLVAKSRYASELAGRIAALSDDAEIKRLAEQIAAL